MELPQAKKDFIDSHFNENTTGQELDRAIFDTLNSCEELHYLMQQHNWDTSITILQWIAQSPLCSEATALEMFWLAQPKEYLKFKWNKILQPTYKNETFSLIKTIVGNFEKGLYAKSNLHFDPKTFVSSTFVIDPIMACSTIGEPSYLYYEQSDVMHWFDEHWQRNIQRADSCIELFNIAYYINEPQQAQWVLQNPLCDSAIATLVFWRLHNFCSVYIETPLTLAQIQHSIKEKTYDQVLQYDPKQDPRVKIDAAKNAWDIPLIMFQAI